MIKFLEWTATIITLAGAILTTLAIDPLNVYMFNLGSLLWAFWAILEKKYSILIVNMGMLLIYVSGSLIRILEIDLYKLKELVYNVTTLTN